MHKLTDIDHETRLGVCSICGPTRVILKERRKTGYVKYGCYTLERERWGRRSAQDKTTHRRAVLDRIKALRCERPGCDFVAEDTCQLDVDHIVRRIDGGADTPDNLMVLCANCHRLKTRLENSGKPLPRKS